MNGNNGLVHWKIEWVEGADVADGAEGFQKKWNVPDYDEWPSFSTLLVLSKNTPEKKQENNVIWKKEANDGKQFTTNKKKPSQSHRKSLNSLIHLNENHLKLLI